MSIASMTGFARVQGHDDTMSWTWELRSVNGRGLDIRCKLPPGFDALDAATREAATRRFKRGNVSVGLSVVRTAEQPTLRVNDAMLRELVGIAQRCRELFPAMAPPTLDGLLAVRGVIEAADMVEDETVRESRERAMRADLDRALDALAAARSEEGGRLAEVLRGQIATIADLAERAEQTAALRPDAVRERLRAQVQALLDMLPAPSEERLTQEAALIAARGDVREELDRLKAHVAGARDMLKEGGAVGRRLDFLCQEFNREANTLCSKSGDVDLTRIGLELKATIEQFREQVQNIE